MATCGTMIEGNVVSFMCDLPVDHDGPHRAVENARSVRERNRWEAKQREDAETPSLATFQGPAQTTAERYTENPTPVPQTRQQREEARQQREEARSIGLVSVDADDEDDIPEEVPAEAERPIVYTEGADGSQFRQASPAEAKVAGLAGRITSRRCPSCDGQGVWEDDHSGGPCGRCGGTGTIPEPGPNQQESTFVHDTNWDYDAIAAEREGMEPTKQREGDQPLPTPTQGEYVQERMIAKVEKLRSEGGLTNEQADFLIGQLRESMKVGMQRYGTPLQTFNGRDCLQDLADELRDAGVYINSLMQAREAQREVLVDVVTRILEGDQRLAECGTEREIAEVAVDAILKATGGFDT